MNREIRFRAWSTKLKKMMFDIQENILTFNMIMKSKEEYPLMQYTGVKDCDGYEIFEGDIIEDEQGIRYEVRFYHGSFIGYNGYALSSSEAFLQLVRDKVPFHDDTKNKVLGNIFQNSELLERVKL